MNRIFACLPCYNESENILPLTRAWLEKKDVLLSKGYKLTIVAIDDNSTDDTLEKMKSEGRENPEDIVVIHHRKNLNLGGGVRTAFNYFHREGKAGDLCVLMDGDNTHDPVYTPAMIDKIEEGADCVIASRYRDGSKVKGVPAFRRLLSDGAGLYYKIMLGVPGVRDYTCGYRVYTYDIIEKALSKYGKRLVEKRTFACMMEVLYKLFKVGAVFDEVPFELRYDLKQGESKMKILKTIKDSLVTAFMLRVKTK